MKKLQNYCQKLWKERIISSTQNLYFSEILDNKTHWRKEVEFAYICDIKGYITSLHPFMS